MKLLLLAAFLNFGTKLLSQSIFEFTDNCAEVGDVHRIELRFPTCTWEGFEKLSEMSVLEMDSLAYFLKNNSTIRIEIGRYTDVRGSDSMNLRYSQYQADYAKEYLIKKGIDSSRITAIGFGESQPINSEQEINHFKVADKRKFEQMHQENNRTIVKILAID